MDVPIVCLIINIILTYVIIRSIILLRASDKVFKALTLYIVDNLDDIYKEDAELTPMSNMLKSISEPFSSLRCYICVWENKYKLITNEDTYNKIKKYLDGDYLD